MKIGVISDIHSNVIAFRACTKYMEEEGCNEYLFLGDYISDTPYTRETLDYLYDFIKSHTCQLLRGNREEYMLTQQEMRKERKQEQIWRYNSASGNLLYTYELLTDYDFEFFRNLPITFEYKKEGYPALTCCHGSPSNSRELIQLGSENAKQWLDKIPNKYMICGHTHFPGEYAYNGKRYFNSGCVGIAIHDAGYAQCLILEDGIDDAGDVIWKPTFLKIPYDNQKVVTDIVSSGLLEKAPWFINSNIQILLTGTDNSAQLVAKAGELADKAGGKRWPEIDEKYFAIAADELNIPDYRQKERLHYEA